MSYILPYLYGKANIEKYQEDEKPSMIDSLKEKITGYFSGEKYRNNISKKDADGSTHIRPIAMFVLSKNNIVNAVSNKFTDDDCPLITRRVNLLYDFCLLIGLSALFAAVSASSQGCAITNTIKSCLTCACTYQCDGVTYPCDLTTCECPNVFSSCSLSYCSSTSGFQKTATQTGSNSCAMLSYKQAIDVAYPISILSNFLKSAVSYGKDKIVSTRLKLTSDDKFLNDRNRLTPYFHDYFIIMASCAILIGCIMKSMMMPVGDKPASYRSQVVTISIILSAAIDIPMSLVNAASEYLSCYFMIQFFPDPKRKATVVPVSAHEIE